MTEPTALERILRRDRAITLAGLLIVCLLAWTYVLTGAGLGMSAWEMTTASLFPHASSHPTPMSGMDMPGMDMSGMKMDGGAAQSASWSPSTWALVIAMWWVMMVAMMSPSAAPTILLYARVHRHAAAQKQVQQPLPPTPPTGAFTAGYLVIWLSFSVLAATFHWLLTQSGQISATTMGSQSRYFSGAVLIAAGIYQFSPLKNLCLSHCRAPSEFLSRHWRPGAGGAFRLGALHGAYCVGCCWALMALLFVGGVMNLIWIAALALLVMAEKIAPGGRWVGRSLGILFLVWGVATFFV